MKIGILLVGRASEDLVDKYGTYAEMLINLINSDEKLFDIFCKQFYNEEEQIKMQEEIDDLLGDLL